MKVIINNKKINLVEANNFLKKLKGLMFQKNINYCLRLKTNNIHTFFMREPIDIIMTDKNNNILYIFKDVKKNKIIIRPKVYYTYEFPNKYLDTNVNKIEITN